MFDTQVKRGSTLGVTFVECKAEMDVECGRFWEVG